MSADIVKIDEKISYIKATEAPLSADVGLIFGSEYLWLYDVGNDPETTDTLNAFDRPKNAVLSHFHADHTGAIGRLDIKTVYLGAKTQKYVGCGEVVRGDIYIDDGVKLHIFELPSSHAQGSLGLEVGDYAFLGDGIYSTVKSGREVYNAGLLQAQIAKLKSLSAKYFLLSHEQPFIRRRESVIRLLEMIYSRRQKNEAYIAADKR